MQQIADWLEKLGMSEYTERFVENGIEIDVLCELTDQDLEKLGVLLGHRRRMLRAIRDLGDNSAPVTGPSALVTTEPTRQDSAERRQLTVMFCDLVGSTALSARLDPEDLHGIVGTYHRCCNDLIKRNGGFVAKYMGDGVLAYFGYPQAHEHDAERAVRAGLAVLEAVPKLETAAGIPLQVRIGIATGLVVVGDLIGSGEAQERGIVGETPNLAARLQGIAEPNMVIIADDTRRLLGDLFELDDLGRKDLKGIVEPERAWAALRARSIESRFEALHTTGLTTLVGREEEFELLLRRWSRAKTGEGQVVLLSGEAGIGKSRLTAELLERVAVEPHTRRRYFCSPHHQDTALHPFITQIEHAARFDREDTVATKIGKLELLLAQSGENVGHTVTLVADLLSLLADIRGSSLPADPTQRRELILVTLIGQLEVLVRHRPGLVLFEDAHWADSTSLELLDRIVERLPPLPVLLVITFRPEFQPPWAGQARVTTLALNRLGEREARALVDAVTGGKSLPTEVRSRILDHADGIPLFIEELTKTVLEGELLREEAAGYALAGPLSPLAIPSTLNASLMARLDRLAPVKEVAQIGAAIDREFSYELIAAVVRRSDDQLSNALDQLTAAGLISRRGTPPRASFMFKHALIQDAAYSTLLRSQRQELHARIANVLEQKFPGMIERQPETLAHHYSEAGLVDLAIEFWRRAGVRSVDRSAHREAVGHFGCALDLLANLPPDLHRDERELELRLALAVPLIAVHGFGSTRVEDCAVKGKDLSDKLYGSQSRFAAQRVAWNSSLMRQPVPRTLVLAKDLVALAEEDGNPAKLAVAHRALGYSLLIAGEFREAAEILARGATLADTIAEGEFAIYGEHPSMVCRAYGGQAKILMGFPDSGARLVNASVAYGRHQNNAHSLAWALSVAAHIFHLQHEPMATARFASEAIDTAREHRLPQWLALGERSNGWATQQLGDFMGGLNLLRQGVRRWYETGAALHTTHCEISLAESYLLQGQSAAARSHLAAAQAHSRRYGEIYLAAEMKRLEALLLQCEGAPTAMIEECLANALATARQAEARLFELRSATALARAMAEHHERHKAIDLLAPIYGWFTEGFDTLDLKEAKALLDELA
jgi:class 3 adenylate cyclase/tetratricopeptide (TPR) repeat protein